MCCNFSPNQIIGFCMKCKTVLKLLTCKIRETFLKQILKQKNFQSRSKLLSKCPIYVDEIFFPKKLMNFNLMLQYESLLFSKIPQKLLKRIMKYGPRFGFQYLILGQGYFRIFSTTTFFHLWRSNNLTASRVSKQKNNCQNYSWTISISWKNEVFRITNK